jgi:hypothetical protein
VIAVAKLRRKVIDLAIALAAVEAAAVFETSLRF